VDLLLQVAPPSIWNAPSNSAKLWLLIFATIALGLLVIFGLTKAPAQVRTPLVTAVTFLSGLFYVLFWAFPSPINRKPTDLPRNPFEGFSFWLSDAQPVVANFTNIIAAFLVGLGIYSLLRIHVGRLVKMQKDWAFSLTLLVSLVAMALLGYVDYYQRLTDKSLAGVAPGMGGGFVQYAKDLLFDGVLQEMDAAMFSLVGFYILSAAYRAFRARSVEATILLVAALIMMLSILGLVVGIWDGAVNSVAEHAGPVRGLLENLRLTDIAAWIKNTFQTSSIRALDFGVGIGLLAMGVRIWLNLEKTGADA
jgi:hypothetical protein